MFFKQRLAVVAFIVVGMMWGDETTERIVLPSDPEQHPVQALEGKVELNSAFPPVHEINTFRSELIKRVYAVVKSPTEDRSEESPVCQGMIILGEWRADDPDVISELANRLTYDAGLETDAGFIYAFPAAYALAQIGERSHGALIRQIINEKSSVLRRRLAAYTLVLIEIPKMKEMPLLPDEGDNNDLYRMEKNEVKAFLDRLIAKDSFNAEEKQRLTEAKGYVDEWDDGNRIQEIFPEYQPEDPWADE